MKHCKFPSFRRPAAILIGVCAAALLAGCAGRDVFPGDEPPIQARRISSKAHYAGAPIRKAGVHKAKPVAIRAAEPVSDKFAAPAIYVQPTPPIVHAPLEAPRPLAPETNMTSVEPPVAAKAEPMPALSESAAPISPPDSRPSAASRRGADTPAAPPRPVVQQIPTTPQGITAVIEQAELFLRIGNISGARRALEPLARAKNPDALAELGKTYDPIELQKFLVPPGVADPVRATEYYTEAARLGSSIARSRMERLNPKPLPPVEKQR